MNRIREIEGLIESLISSHLRSFLLMTSYKLTLLIEISTSEYYFIIFYFIIFLFYYFIISFLFYYLISAYPISIR